jgi:hypothetical protein
MEVCPNCFADKELKGFISSSTNIGHCNVCSSDGVHLLNLAELLDFFQELINNFVTAKHGEPLRMKIQGVWSFFSTHAISTVILNEVLPQLITPITNSEELVEYQADIIDNISHWDILKDELKWSRRYISDISRLEDLGWDSYFNTQYQLNPTEELFRARLHHESGLPAFTIDQMMCPPKHLTTGGRANPSGIPYLYLSDNSETVLYEVRAAYLDELTIGVFKLEDSVGSIKIVDFTEDTSLFQPGKVNETIKGRLLRSMISRDLSKPMRRYDSDIEYIATQFICEFIKIFTGASGIRFSSSLHPSGTNFVIFDQALMKCTKVILKKINHLSLKSIEIV